MVLGGLMAPAAVANAQTGSFQLAPLVVTASMMDTPYQLQSDPRQPRASVPAPDGGAYLKEVPGFSVSRKGGTAGEPALRGLGGSRLSILADGSAIGGGCTARMDPPTAYIFPQSYDRIEITKGPQSVRYGVAPGGSVRFVRDTPRFSEQETRGFLSYTGGSFNRNDLAAEILSGSTAGYLRFNSLISSQDDYQDGSGERVHSQFERWSTQATAGWTPDERSTIEASYERSDAESAYDDRRMDGTDFDRTGYRLRMEREDITPWLERLEALYFYNDIDHVMDNFRLRDPQMMTMARRVQRRSSGGRLESTLVPFKSAVVEAGLDYVENRHGDSGRIAQMGEPLTALKFRGEPVEDQARFLNLAVFMEWEQTLARG
ncbi:MAG: TonB-dependent copper receptor, partial [Halomonadaceae bacterium]